MRADWVATPSFAMKSSEHPAPHPTNVLLCSSLLASQLCGGQTSRKTHLLYPVLSIKYPCSPINIYMDSNKTIVITVESTQVTSGHSCPLHNLQIILYSYYVILWKDPLPFHLQCISAFFFTARQGRKLSSHRALPGSVHGSNFDNWFMANLRYNSGILSIDVRFMYVIWMYFDVLHPIFFLSARNSNGSIQTVPYHPTWWFAPLVCWKWHTFYPFWCHIPQGILNSIRATEGHFGVHSCTQTWMDNSPNGGCSPPGEGL